MKKKIIIFYIIILLTIYTEYYEILCLSFSSLPIKTYININSPSTQIKIREELNKKGGVYGIIHTGTYKHQYIDSSLNLNTRLLAHIKGRNSNARLQRSIKKYGLDNFNCVIYYLHEDPAVILTDIETKIIKSFPFKNLYNFKTEANSMLGYKHTLKAIEKMKQRFKNKDNHPMYGKNHTYLALQKISKPGELNPMYGKSHKDDSKKKISLALSKNPLGLYDINLNLLSKFKNQADLAKYLNCSIPTIGRYLKNSKIINSKYIILKL